MLLCPRCRIWHFDLLNFIPFIIDSCVSIYRDPSARRLVLGLRQPRAPPSWVLWANWLMDHSAPAPRWLISILGRTGPRMDPRGALLVTKCHTDAAPGITTLSHALQPVLHPCTVIPLVSQLDNLPRRMLWGTKILLKSEKGTSTAFSSPTKTYHRRI